MFSIHHLRHLLRWGLAAALAASLPVTANPLKPGGDTTLEAGRISFSEPAPGLSLDERMPFNLGDSIFDKLWVSSPASTKASDGLGPLYNARSCARCHLNNGRGHPPEEGATAAINRSFLLRLSIPPRNREEEQLLNSGQIAFIPEPTYGGQLQDQALQGLPAEGRIGVRYEEREVTFPDGETVTLRSPHYRVEGLNYGPLHPETRFSGRVAPPMIGLGLLEAIPDRELLANEEQQVQADAEISGRVNRVWDISEQTSRLGRFGWKAGHPTINQQNAAAFIEDIGISSLVYPQGHGGCTAEQAVCRQLPNGNSEHLDGVEASRDVMRVLEFYTRALAVPARRNADHPAVKAGENLFHQVGCAQCHRPSYTTSADAPAFLAEQTIWPYTDLLLHDMGDGLADEHPEFQAGGSEWRTPPLWGVGLTQAINGHSQLLHDGRARNIMEAILWHGGEAETVKNRFMQLTREQRLSLIEFVESL
ncbi:di-heme oxidoredictase family protein [Marinospirillum perlucidum]|uniref:di-heme oxidoreductase family protein n=1 Tax=Marinospirillum perlucidum TaxID=1982602 RepID=UPI000DF20F56|nr:di-heme oxidoredictase family protein [Marinospirillum perlucidum]